jgi:hypothetical protein
MTDTVTEVIVTAPTQHTVEVLAAVYGDGGELDAADIAFTPTGTVAATNVQSAIGEVANEADARLDVIEDDHDGMNHVLLLAEGDPVPITTPAGTIIVRY